MVLTTLVYTVHGTVQCQLPIHWHLSGIYWFKRESAFQCDLCTLTLPLCRCESECDMRLTMDWNLLIDIRTYIARDSHSHFSKHSGWKHNAGIKANELALYCTLASILTSTVVFTGKIKITLICNFYRCPRPRAGEVWIGLKRLCESIFIPIRAVTRNLVLGGGHDPVLGRHTLVNKIFSNIFWECIENLHKNLQFF